VTGVVIRPLRQDEADAVAAWAYEAPYDIYDGDPANAADLLAIDDDGYGYYGIARRDTDEVIGFCCFGVEARVRGQDAQPGTVDVGGGVRPDLLSRGLATQVFPSILEFARQRFAPERFRTAIAAFNERSTRLCLSAGFEAVRRFDVDGREFQELVRDA
jgi:[ribosomal protein S18]-alanine N-acetyltransferase